VNWVDTPLLVYAAVANHPAKATVEASLRRDTWGSTALVLLELYQVLTRDYAVAPSQAAESVERLARSPMHWASLEPSHAVTALPLRRRYHLQSADAVLILLAREDRGTVVSQDHGLLRAATAEGLAVRNPITPDVAAAIERWEARHLPERGLPRILGVTERWLRAEDAQLADRYLQATAHLKKLPA
jgi:predicted nucleic acid-binding protein